VQLTIYLKLPKNARLSLLKKAFELFNFKCQLLVSVISITEFERYFSNFIVLMIKAIICTRAKIDI
jgi:hypothetical protein